MDRDWMIITERRTGKVVDEEPCKDRGPAQIRKELEHKYPFSNYDYQFHSNDEPVSSALHAGLHKGWEVPERDESPSHVPALTH